MNSNDTSAEVVGGKVIDVCNLTLECIKNKTDWCIDWGTNMYKYMIKQLKQNGYYRT